MYPLSVIIGDINGLKLINDALGHDEGDKLIVSIAEILMSCCRTDDIIARTGGDEFSILLPKTKKEEANKIIRQIGNICEKYKPRIMNEAYHVSISLGCATKISREEPFNSIIKEAEDNMYRNKLLQSKSLHSSIISSMKSTLYAKSQETEEHANRLISLSKAIGLSLDLTDVQLNELELLSTLHDIGKIGISDTILNKPAKLNEDEWVEMRKHPEIGYRIAMSSPELVSIADYILSHHERWDGTGYPQGLKGEDIPLLSRIIAVADAYDAMTADRPYRSAISKMDAIEEIKKNAGTQFDPKIAELFLNILA
jgi:diguanylate cyclase (GGDEF)-like protein